MTDNREPLVDEIHNAEDAIVKYAAFYHALERECPAGFKFLMMINGWRNPFNALHELLKRIYANERLLTMEQKKGYKSRYREMEALVHKYENNTMRELRG